MEKQLRLDLDDRKQYLRALIESNPVGTDQSWYVFYPYRRHLTLGIRTHDLSGTEYDYLERVSLEEAERLLQEEFVHPYRLQHQRVLEFMGSLHKYREHGE